MIISIFYRLLKKSYLLEHTLRLLHRLRLKKFVLKTIKIYFTTPAD